MNNQNLLPASLLVFVGILIFLTVFGFGFVVGNYRRSSNTTYQQKGYEANQLNISPNANPYQGTSRGELWLDGWIKAEKEND